MPGQMGLVKTVYDPEDGSLPDWNDFSGTVVEESAALTFETTRRFDQLFEEDADATSISSDDFESDVAVDSSNYLTVMDGWFKAPSTGNFKFYMSCDDECKLEFDSTNYYGSGSSYSMSTILEQNSWMQFRSYLQNWGSHAKTTTEVKSSSYSLTEGRYYRIRGQHKNHSGSAHFTVSLLAENAFTQVNGADHPNGQREIQVFEIDQDQTPEQWEIEITSPTSDGGFFLTMTKEDGETVYVPEEAEDNFSFDTSAGNLCNHLQRDYFNPVKGTSVSCTRVMYDELDAETSDFSLATKIIFTIISNRRYTGNSFVSI